MSGKTQHRTPHGFRKITQPGRVTYDPNDKVRSIHRQFLAYAEQFPVHFADPLPDVRKHLEFGHRYFLKTDLSSAFDQVTLLRLDEALCKLGIELKYLLPIEYFFHDEGAGGLIQGAPASPYLFETYCRHGGLDHNLWDYCDKLGFHYTQYIDDILISSKRFLGRRVSPKVRSIVAKYGFALSDRKTKTVDTHSEPLEVLGYVIQGTRLNPGPQTLQSVHDLPLSSEAQTGIFRWRRHIKEKGRQRRVLHK